MYVIKYKKIYYLGTKNNIFSAVTQLKDTVQYRSLDTAKRQLDSVLRSAKNLKKYNIDVSQIKIEELISTVVPSKQLSFDIENFAIDLQTKIEELKQRRSDLATKLSICDKKEQDLLHYIEFTKLDVRRICKIYKLIKENRTERRDIKNELDKITYTLGSFNDNIANVDKEIKGLTLREYTPRILTELFDKGI